MLAAPGFLLLPLLFGILAVAGLASLLPLLRGFLSPNRYPQGKIRALYLDPPLFDANHSKGGLFEGASNIDVYIYIIYMYADA